MCIHDEAMFIRAFDELLSCYMSETITAFLQNSFLLPEKASLSSSSLQKKVYVDGNDREVYTKQERNYIDNLEETIYLYERFCTLSEDKQVNCRIVAVHIDDENDTLLNSIAFMKIINKSLDGFNTFLFAYNNGIRIGCASFNTKHDCVISELMTKNVNTEFLYNIFLYRNDSDLFYEYYYSFIEMIDSLKNCVTDTEANIRYSDNYSLDNNIFEDVRNFDIDRFVSSLPLELSEKHQQIDFSIEFDESQDIESCFEELSYIKKNSINSLDMLFEAEKFIEKMEEQKIYINNDYPYNADLQEKNIDFDLLDDPLFLLKMLKKDQGILN